MVEVTNRAVGIADADPGSLAKLKRAVGKLGYQVVTARNGADLLLPFKNGKLLILITDTELRDMDGLKLISAIRDLDTGFPIVVTTKDYSKNLEMAYRKQGIAYYARKPLNFEVIRWIIDRHLGYLSIEVTTPAWSSAKRS